MRFKLIVLLGAIAAIVIVAAGCGGGSDSTSATSSETDGGKATTAKSENDETTKAEKPLTKTEFNTRVNEICIQVPPTYEEELKKLEKGGTKLSLTEKNLKAAVPPLYAAIEQMETVVPPAGEEEKLKKMISTLESAAKGLEAKPTSELSGPKSPFAEFQQASKELGFETCSGL